MIRLYYGSFLDYDNRTIKVDIYDTEASSDFNLTEDNSTGEEIIFTGSNPVIINHSGEANDLFNPIKKSSCKVGIVTNKLLTNLYTPYKEGIFVKVRRDEQILFEGFMTPNAYSQDLSGNLNSIELEFIDYIGMFQYLTVDEIFDKNEVLTYFQVFSRIAQYIRPLDDNRLFVDSSLSLSSNPLFWDLQVQIKNFFDESDKADTIEKMVGEMLQILTMSISFIRGRFIIDNMANISSNHKYYVHYWDDTDDLVYRATYGNEMEDYTIGEDTPLVSIDDTYSKFAIIASTNAPKFENNIEDYIDYEDTESYKFGHINIKKDKIGNTDEGTYAFNGVYTNEDFGIYSNGLNKFVNCPSFYDYADNDYSVHEYGSVYNFYGTAENHNITQAIPNTEIPVNIEHCITAFAKPNGVAPECLVKNDLQWLYRQDTIDPDTDETLKINDGVDTSRFGKYQVGSTFYIRPIYQQTYTGINLNSASLAIDIDMSHFYSRTGFPKNIPISSTKEVISETTEDNTFTQEYYEYPECWQVDKVKFNRLFFNQYDWDTNRYDWRYVFIQIETHDGRKFYFDGMDWKETSGNIAITNGLKIGYHMNDKATYYTKFKPEVISHDGYYYYFDPQSPSQESWIQRCNNIREIDNGRFSIKLPVGINDTNSTLTIKVSNSDFLGRCGEVYYTYYNGIFKPANMTYIKGEHLNFKCDVVVPESNLGQMFAKSDIRYSSNTGKKYSQEAKEVTFNVNTYHPLVNTSTSYLMFDDRYLEKNILYQYWQTRLEEYCLAAYQNHYGQIRKVYQNTLKFNNTHDVNWRMMRFSVPYLSEETFLTVSADWDVKTGRTNIVGVEYNPLETSITATIQEVPHVARNERYRYL